MKRLFTLIPLLALALLALTGCREAADVNNRVLVFALGLDDGPSPDTVEVSIHYFRSAQGGQQANQGGQAGRTSITRTASAKTVTEALEKLRAESIGPIFLGSLRLVVIGSEHAQNGVRNSMLQLIYQPQIPNSMMTTVSEGRAAEMLTTQVDAAPSSAVMLVTSLMAEHPQETMLPVTPWWQLLDHVLDPTRSSIVATAQVADRAVTISGATIFHGDRAVRTLTRDQAALVLPLIRRGTSLIRMEGEKDDKHSVLLRFRQLQGQARLAGETNKVVVRLRGTAYQAGRGVGQSAPDYSKVSAETNRFLERSVQELLGSLYADKLDVLDLSEQIRRRSPGGELHPNWDERLPELRFQVHGEVKVLHGLRGS